MQVRYAPIRVTIVIGLGATAAPGDLVPFPDELARVVIAVVNTGPEVSNAGEPVRIIPTTTNRRRYSIVPAMRLLAPACVVNDCFGLVLPGLPGLELAELVAAILVALIRERSLPAPSHPVIRKGGRLTLGAAVVPQAIPPAIGCH